MKAAVLYGNEDIRYEDWPEPELVPGSVKVRVMACGICGSDVPRVLNSGAHYYPIVLGHEFSGYVEQTAPDVKSVVPGQHVAAVPLLPCMKCPDCQKGSYSQCGHYSFIGSREQGGFAEYVVLPERNVVVVDEKLHYEQAALFEPCTVSLHGLKLSGYEGGRTVAVLGAGTIGAFALQWAKLYGARRLVAFDIIDEQLALAKRLGADDAINTLDEDFMDRAMALTGGRGFDYVFEAAGSPATVKLALELAANKASVCLIGTPTRDVSFTVREWGLINRRELKLTGSWMSCSAPFPGDAWRETADFFANGRLKYFPELFHAVYELRDAKEAFMQFKKRGGVKGRILLRVGDFKCSAGKRMPIN